MSGVSTALYHSVMQRIWLHHGTDLSGLICTHCVTVLHKPEYFGSDPKENIKSLTNWSNLSGFKRTEQIPNGSQVPK